MLSTCDLLGVSEEISQTESESKSDSNSVIARLEGPLSHRGPKGTAEEEIRLY